MCHEIAVQVLKLSTDSNNDLNVVEKHTRALLLRTACASTFSCYAHNFYLLHLILSIAYETVLLLRDVHAT
jgi:hypothetical protein